MKITVKALAERKKWCIAVLILVLFFVAFKSEFPAQAEDFFASGMIPAERPTPYIVAAADGSLVFSAKSGTSTAELPFTLATAAASADVKDHYQYDDNLLPASDLYTLTLSPASAGVIADFGLEISFQYPTSSRLYNLYLWDPLSENFVRIASQRDLQKRRLNWKVTDYGEFTLALFEEKLAQGKASWYVHPRYRQELMAASTVLAKGTKVKVTNLANDKSVIVTIKDYGPDPIKHPDRVIDLNKVAFKKIASTRAGIIEAVVEPVNSATSSGLVLKK